MDRNTNRKNNDHGKKAKKVVSSMLVRRKWENRSTARRTAKYTIASWLRV